MRHKKKNQELQKNGLGFFILFIAILTVVHWTLVPEQSQSKFLWGLLDAAFIIIPLLYMLSVCSGAKNKKKAKEKCKELDFTILVPLALAALVTTFQVATGKVGIPDPIWAYLDALIVISYPFAAGKLINPHIGKILS